MRDSLCGGPFCSMYEHRHCLDCNITLDGIGDGPIEAGDPDRTVGYEDAHVCAGCGDDFYMKCGACFAKDPLCAECRKERTACHAGCDECRTGGVVAA